MTHANIVGINYIIKFNTLDKNKSGSTKFNQIKISKQVNVMNLLQ